MSRLRWMPVLALSAVGVLLLASVAIGKATSVKSTVTIASGEGALFTGKVTAAKKKCRANRTVKLYTEGGAARPGDTLVDTAKTDATGSWRMDGDFFAGVYYAQVLALLVTIEGHPYRCLGDLSIRMHY